MKSLIVNGINDYQIIEQDVPPLSDDQVLVRVEYAGICGSDLHIIHGQNPFATYPRITGHEFVGTIEKIGNRVSAFEVGTNVVINPVISCGQCRLCQMGRSNVCTELKVIGVHTDGGFTQFQAVPASNVIALPDSIDLRAATLIEPYSIAANVFSRLNASAGDTILIYGAGVIGLTIVQVANVLGISSIIVDLLDEKLETAKQLGATCTINPKQENTEQRVMALTNGQGVPLIADAACIPSLIPEMMRIAAPAGTVCLLGFSSEDSPLQQVEVIKKELTIVGSRLNNRMFPKVIEWMAQGKLDTDSLISHEFTLDTAPSAIKLIETEPQKVRKALIKLH
ncbi:zinc-binding alcohol dehydrogenase family protein (plasmid) [Photobacterium sp. GJ3]|uniref:zinc-binding alcohol dehydrogenase family protein n=1 Tax=Photobacterium sp. GJ3 TaxID=2829502 RepID=UPI001B8CED72|nr:zinc-binding alcohol dehydrogenase family protein [Photobacterium sp. GJ3]QUJ69884.1 zinc-binding alcohol dehydrogenase family protein [Photobacterium sp. GJ3]